MGHYYGGKAVARGLKSIRREIRGWISASALIGGMVIAGIGIFSDLPSIVGLGGLLLLLLAVLVAFPILLILCLCVYAIASACVLGFYLLTESHFGTDWAGLTSWFFRVVGVSLALAVLGFVWFLQWRERHRLALDWPSRVTEPPSDLPAAAVSELVDRNEGFRTPVTIVLEMIQKGTLRVVVGSAEYVEAEDPVYRLVEQPGPKYKWERALCDALPQESQDISELWKRLSDPGLGIRQHLRAYLQDRGLLSREHSGRGRHIWTKQLIFQWSILMWVGLFLWFPHLWVVWWAGLGMVGLIYGFGLLHAVRQLLEASVFTYIGRAEVIRWYEFGFYLDSSEFSEVRLADTAGTDPLVPYAVALNRMRPWEEHPPKFVSWIEESGSASGGYLSNPRRVGLDASMLGHGLIFDGGGLDSNSGGWLDSSASADLHIIPEKWLDVLPDISGPLDSAFGWAFDGDVGVDIDL